MRDARLLHGPIDRSAAVLGAFDLAHEVEVGTHAHIGIERHRFRQIADVGARLEGLRRHIETCYFGATSRRWQVPGEDAHGRGLTRAIWTEKAQDFTLFYVERHVGHGDARSVVFGQVFNAYH